MDAADAERRARIRILSSMEGSEAQHRVKLLLLSLLLFIISYVKLISRGLEVQLVQSWKTSDYCFLFMSGFGCFVAILGIKAANENTSASVHKYLKCLVLCGIAWNSYSYYMNVTAQRDAAIDRAAANNDTSRDHNYPPSSSSDDDNTSAEMVFLNDADIYISAAFVAVPLFVLAMCFIWAWQFGRLVEEAEAEARGSDTWECFLGTKTYWESGGAAS